MWKRIDEERRGYLFLASAPDSDKLCMGNNYIWFFENNTSAADPAAADVVAAVTAAAVAAPLYLGKDL